MTERISLLPPSLLVFETPSPTVAAPRLVVYRFADEDETPARTSNFAATGWQLVSVPEMRDSSNDLSRIADANPDMVLLDARGLMLADDETIHCDNAVAMCEAIRDGATTRSLPLMILLPEGDDDRALACARAGADNFFCEPLPQDMIAARLDTLRQQRDFAHCDATERIVLSLLCATEAKDFRLRRHAERVASYADQISLTLQLPTSERMALRHGSLLHDVGNIGIADSILLKPGGLSDWEFDEVRLHTIIGEQICKPLRSMTDILPMVRSHHEKLDGSGYPDGLKGDQIPFLVKVLSVIDVYDTLRSDRVYRGAFGHDDALDILVKEAARGWWDPEVVALLDTLTAPDKDFPLV